MSDARDLRVTLVLSDWAESVNGKLYMMGGGWTMILSDRPVPMAISALIHVPYDQTNKRRNLQLRLVNEDGAGYPTDDPVKVEFGVEVGRPPGMRAGEESCVPFAIRLPAVLFKAGGYRAEVHEGETLLASMPFVAKEKF